MRIVDKVTFISYWGEMQKWEKWKKCDHDLWAIVSGYTHNILFLYESDLCYPQKEPTNAPYFNKLYFMTLSSHNQSIARKNTWATNLAILAKKNLICIYSIWKPSNRLENHYFVVLKNERKCWLFNEQFT